MEDKDKLKIEMLVNQCDDISHNIRHVGNVQHKIVTIAILLFTGILIYGIENETTNPKPLSALLFLLFPIIYFCILLFGLFTHGEIMSLGGYKRFLEEEINAKFGEDLFLWESFRIKPEESHLGAQSDRYNYIAYLIIYFIPTYCSFFLFLEMYENNQYIYILIVVFSISLLLGGICLYGSLNKVIKKHEEIYQNLKEHKEKEIMRPILGKN